MCPYLEFFWCQSPNAGEYGPEKLRIRTLHKVKKETMGLWWDKLCS